MLTGALVICVLFSLAARASGALTERNNPTGTGTVAGEVPHDGRASATGAELSGRSVSASWPMPRGWHAPRAWLPGAICIHQHEGAWNANTGNGYYGGMQFLLSTWRRAGGSGYPHLYSPREQLYRAYVIWRSHGGSWSEWGTRGMCGLR